MQIDGSVPGLYVYLYAFPRMHVMDCVWMGMFLSARLLMVCAEKARNRIMWRQALQEWKLGLAYGYNLGSTEEAV
jgi:hypothetical protein